jgi:hypothetical protein
MRTERQRLMYIASREEIVTVATAHIRDYNTKSQPSIDDLHHVQVPLWPGCSWFRDLTTLKRSTSNF